jgi:error-prone DNA polymerase
VYLNCHTYFSFRYGTLSPGQLVEAASTMGVDCLALTDLNNTSAVFPFAAACREKGIRPVVGIEFRGDAGRRFAGGSRGPLRYVGLALNRQGFTRLNEFLSAHLSGGESLPLRAPELEDCVFFYPLGALDPAALRPDEYIGLRAHEVAGLRLRPELRWMDRLLIWHPVTFLDRTGFNTHRLLRAIDHNTLLSKLPPEAQAHPSEQFCEPAALLRAFEAYPRLVFNTLRLLERCSFEPDPPGPRNRRSFTGNPADDRQLLHKLAMDGWKRRYGGGQEALRRVEHELEVIDRLGFSPYFLITWDIIRYARSRGFRHVGRGSGANSTVAYCMGITDVDPIELDLYFERFINPHRSSPPDFDIDFSWDERDEVTDYIFKRYGRRHTALIATYSTFKGRSILRELGKVFGLPKAEIDRLVRNPNDPALEDPITRLVFRYGQRIADFPNHLSIHAGGVLIAEEPIYRYTATELPPKGFPTTQFDMYVAEDIGLYKYDILSQRGLGHIREGVSLVLANRGERVDIDDVERFKRDPLLNERLALGDTVGCFYIESPAMRQLLRKLRCGDYRTLVAASSIIRPGVAKSGMMRAYIERHHNPGSFTYLHPRMEELMAETYGVMVYQEDVLKVAHHFAGIDLADADILRRAMSGKFRSRDGFDRIRATFFRNCAERGYPESISTEVWRQMESFSGYSFSKAHSASFAVESYQSLYLKAYYPLEFAVAVINNFGGFYTTEFYVNEARRAGAQVHAPCVNHSGLRSGISGRDIWLGFQHIKSLERSLAEQIERERSRDGPYAGLEDLVRRLAPGLEQLNLLIRVGALRFSGLSKKEALWQAAMLFGEAAGRAPRKEAELFQLPARHWSLPDLTHTAIEDAYDEWELMGFPLTSPFALLHAPLPADTLLAADLAAFEGRSVRMPGYLVCTKDVRAGSGERMVFGTFLDAVGEPFDTVHFPPSYKRYPLTDRAVYALQGRVALDFGVATLEVESLERLSWLPDPRYINSSGRTPV